MSYVPVATCHVTVGTLCGFCVIACGLSPYDRRNPQVRLRKASSAKVGADLRMLTPDLEQGDFKPPPAILESRIVQSIVTLALLGLGALAIYLAAVW
jgi:hypothetical protein